MVGTYRYVIIQVFVRYSRFYRVYNLHAVEAVIFIEYSNSFYDL